MVSSVFAQVFVQVRDSSRLSAVPAYHTRSVWTAAVESGKHHIQKREINDNNFQQSTWHTACAHIDTLSHRFVLFAVCRCVARRALMRVCESESLCVSYLKSYRNDSATDFFAHHELLAENGEYKIFPAARCESLAKSHDPLSALLVRVVLPCKQRAPRNSKKESRKQTDISRLANNRRNKQRMKARAKRAKKFAYT